MEFFKPPSQLSDFDEKNWNLWKQKFNIYLKASDKEKVKEDVKVAILLNAIGDEGINIYNTFTQDQQSTLEKLLEAFDKYFLPKTIIPMETFKFNNLLQAENQTIEQYLVELKKQAKLCSFKCTDEACLASYEERMIRDRLIVGINDKQIQARLIRENDIDVTKIMDYCKSIELSKQHIKALNPEESEVHVVSKSSKKCSRCLYEHERNRCPAFNKTCAYCHRRGHFAKACLNKAKENDGSKESTGKEAKKVYENTQMSNDSGSTNNVSYIKNNVEVDSCCEYVYINECKGQNKPSWQQELIVEGKNIQFKLDTGSESSIIPKYLYDSLVIKPKLQKSSLTLISYGNFKLKPTGEVLLNCCHGSISHLIKFIIVDFKAEPLLGLDDCLRFNLIKRINSTSVSSSIILLSTKEDIYNNYKVVFEGLGSIPGVVNIELTEDAKPVVQCQRKIPLALHERLRETLNKLEKKGIIKKVSHPTKWVNSLMIVEKADGSLRLCIDPKPLNKYIKREYFTIPTSNDIMSKLIGKNTFSVIDMKDGFWQLTLNEKSSDLCVFNTPFARYKFVRLPFGISSSPELFQRKCYELFGDIQGVSIYFDDLIIAGKSEADHDQILYKVLERAKENNVKFNFTKFQYRLPKVKFMGHIISSEGIEPDSSNVDAILAIEPAKNRSEVLRILGLAKFFSKFIPNLSDITKNLRNLTRKDVEFVWTMSHDQELDQLKYLVTHSPTLKIFNPQSDITIQCDASSEGLGTVLLQNGHPISFASRTLSKAEKRYAQIEKELAAIVFSFKKFNYFVYGHNVVVQTDHKPLIPIFEKDLDKVSSRLQRMLLQLLKYNIKVVYLPGKEMLVADLLSRSYIKTNVQDDPEMLHVVHTVYNNLPISNDKKLAFQKAIDSDPVLCQIKQYCESQWPRSDKKLTNDLKMYYKLREQIYLCNNLLFLDSKIIVPHILRHEMLSLVHQPHFGIQKTKLRMRQLFYWPTLSKDVESLVLNCETCQLNQRKNQKETLVSHPLPNRPWQYLFSDFFDWERKSYLLIVDSFSNWIEVTETRTKKAEEVIKFCKHLFSQFGIPDVFYSDNVPYNSESFKKFATDWNFQVKFSSPHHHQSNGLAERYVGIIKELLNKAKNTKDLPLLLMEYRNTPLPKMNCSPAQLLLNRIVKTKIPISSNNLMPKIPIDVENRLKQKYADQKRFYDRSAKDLDMLNINENILFLKDDMWRKGKVLKIVDDRSYVLTDENGNNYRRNRRFIKKTNLSFSSTLSAYNHLYEFDLCNFSDSKGDNNLSIRSNMQDSINSTISGNIHNSPEYNSILPNDEKISIINEDGNESAFSNTILSYAAADSFKTDNTHDSSIISGSTSTKVDDENGRNDTDNSSQYDTTESDINAGDATLFIDPNKKKRSRKMPCYLQDYITNLSSDSD